MKKLKIVLSVLLAVALVSSLSILIVNATAPEEMPVLTDNFTTQAGTYSSISGLLNTDENDSAIADGFDFSTTTDGFINVTTPEQTDSSSVATAVVTSKAKTSLDGLSLSISPRQINFTRDDAGRSSVISVLWATDEIGTLNDVGHIDHVGTNGIRDMAKETKGLCITINNSYEKNSGTMTASNVMLTLIDGDFHDACDYRLGYRWSFTARNNYSQSVNCDKTGISSSYEELDITNGLNISVRADDEHGYIVSINGIDYYSAEDIAYYPNNVKDQYADNSFTSLREDIDLSALNGLEGYVSVALTGNRIAGESFSYTISTINGVPAADFEG